MARGEVVSALPAGRGHTAVRAAGGVLLRRAGRRRLEVAAVHRPGRDDWTLPKGKLEAGETLEQCAVREVHEETGYLCTPAAFAGCTNDTDRRGRPKVVAFWLMDPAEPASFDEQATIAIGEVDELRWLELDLARRALTYRRERQLLGAIGSRRLAGLG